MSPGPSEGSLKWCGPTARIFRGCGKSVESIRDIALYELCNRAKFTTECAADCPIEYRISMVVDRIFLAGWTFRRENGRRVRAKRSSSRNIWGRPPGKLCNLPC